MHITAQGLVDVTLSDGGYEIEKMDGGMLPITGTYTPYQKDTLLGDVLAVLHGIKGGSLSFNTQDNSTAFFSFLLYK